MYAKAQLLIPRSAQDTSITDFAATDLAAGEAAIVYLSSSNKLAAYKTGTATSDFSDLTSNVYNKFQVMWRKYNTTDIIVTTPELSLSELVACKKITSDAGTAQSTNVTPTITSPAVGDVYSITLIDTTPGTANLDKWTFETYADATDFAVSDLLNLLTSDINALSDTTNITATNNTTYLTLAGTTKFNHFRVAVNGGNSMTAVIDYAIDLKPADCTYDQIYALETQMKSHGEGITNSIWFPKTYVSEVQNKVYNGLGVFQFELRKPAKHGMNATNIENYTLYIAEDTDINLIDMLIDAWESIK